MEYLLIGGIIIAVLYALSTKKQANAVRAFSSADLAREWFEQNGLDFQQAKYSSYPDDPITTLIGVTRNGAGDPQGFAVEIDHLVGFVTDGLTMTPAQAMQDKAVVAKAKQTGLTIVATYRAALPAQNA